VGASLSKEELMGAFAAIDPKTGGVLAYYNTPSYDPNSFIGGIPLRLWQQLNADPAKPLLNRVSGTGSPQPPGSTFKLMVAAMALNLGVIRPDEVMPVACSGGMYYQGRYARCHDVHGPQSLIPGIMNSCDVYFYQVGIRIGLKRFLEEGTRLGFAARTGIDLPSESRSIFPTGIEWMTDWFGYEPAENEIMSLSIGQGAVTMTPLKMAEMYVALARDDGKAPAPRLAMTDEPSPLGFQLPVTPYQIWLLRKGMRRVVAPPGTAAMTRIKGWDFMGKTGTSQNPHGDDHAWFVGIGGPFDKDPEIVASALVVHGLHGLIASEPVANGINFYLSRKYGLPFERHPVPRMRNRLGLPVDYQWLFTPVHDPPPPGEQPADVAAAPKPETRASRPAAAAPPGPRLLGRPVDTVPRSDTARRQ
jgi:penicillin-binding protein 2